MKTKFHLTFVSFFITTGIFISCANPSNRDLAGLKGNVKSIIEIYYEPKKDLNEWTNGDIREAGIYTAFYDEDGEFMEEKVFSTNYESKYTGIARLDSIIKNNHVLMKRSTMPEDRKSIQFASYDDVTQNSRTNIIKSHKRIKYKSYNAFEEKIYSGKSILRNNRIIKKIDYTHNGKEIVNQYTTVYEYDEKENPIMLKQKDRKGETTLYRKFKYVEFDEKDNWIKKLEYFSEEEENPENVVIRQIEYY